MIATKILGLTAAFSKSKKIKIGILLVEIALLAFALSREDNNEDEVSTESNKQSE